jgi:ribosomal protein L16/L10AE
MHAIDRIAVVTVIAFRSRSARRGSTATAAAATLMHMQVMVVRHEAIEAATSIVMRPLTVSVRLSDAVFQIG